MNSLIYKDYFYTASKASLEYYIVADGKVIFRGKSWRNPDTGLVKINVGDIVRDYMGFNLPDFRPLDDVVTRQEDAYKVFELYDANGVKMDEYKVLFDWYGEWNGEQKVLSNPIDGVLDPRMKILWTVFGPEAFDVIMESGPISINTYFRLLTTIINMGIEGGSYRVRWLTDYYPSSEWTVEIPGLTDYSYSDASFSGITINIPSNQSLHSREYEIYYHIQDKTFGVTTIKQKGGEFHVEGDIEIGPESGDTAQITWTTDYTGATITCIADDWLEVTDITVTGATIHAKTENESLGPRTGRVSIYVDGELVWTVTVTQAGKYFRMISTVLNFSDIGGTQQLLWDTDILTAALSVQIDNTAFTATDISKTGCTVTATMNEEGDAAFAYANVYSGTTLLGKVILTQEGADFEARPLTIKMLSGGSITYITARSFYNDNYIPYYRINGGELLHTWNIYQPQKYSARQCWIDNLNAGDSIEFFVTTRVEERGRPGRFGLDIVKEGLTVASMPQFEAKGNVMSMHYGENFYGKKTFNALNSFDSLFWKSKIVHAHNLVLPATELPYAAYAHMFEDCSLLLTPPKELPAFTPVDLLNDGGDNYQYSEMFMNCTSLAYAPRILTNTATGGMCENMFYGCKSLEYIPEMHFTGKTGGKSFYRMFRGCSSLKTAPITLDLESIGTFDCLEMFRDCISLVEGIELPATEFAPSACQGMFQGCVSMVKGPSVLSNNPTGSPRDVYREMFRGCTSLSVAPKIYGFMGWADGMFENCVSLKKVFIYSDWGCGSEMFNGCSSLEEITFLSTHISTVDTKAEFTDWVKGVKSNGTFIKNPNANNWLIGDNGIPNGWNVVDYIE